MSDRKGFDCYLKNLTVQFTGYILDKAGISRNAFYQHYRYKEDLYDQMVARATEGIRDSLMPIIQDASVVTEDTIISYAKHIIEGI